MDVLILLAKRATRIAPKANLLSVKLNKQAEIDRNLELFNNHRCSLIVYLALMWEGLTPLELFWFPIFGDNQFSSCVLSLLWLVTVSFGFYSNSCFAGEHISVIDQASGEQLGLLLWDKQQLRLTADVRGLEFSLCRSDIVLSPSFISLLLFYQSGQKKYIKFCNWARGRLIKERGFSNISQNQSVLLHISLLISGPEQFTLETRAMMRCMWSQKTLELITGRQESSLHDF